MSRLLLAATLLAIAPTLHAQTPAPAPEEKPLPSLDLSSIDLTADPCADFYKFACGNFAKNHPIPADQTGVDPFYVLFNVDTQELHTILEATAAAKPDPTKPDPRTSDEQKIGDYYSACLDTAAIDAVGLKPIQPWLDQIDALSPMKTSLAALTGQLQRIGVNVFFGFGEQQDLHDATKQIAFAEQGGLGLPEKDYYLRTGADDIKIRTAYVAHIAKMLTLAGEPEAQAATDAANILAFETALAKASLGVVDLRDPEKTYHLQPIDTFTAALPGVNFTAFEDAIHSPHVAEINNATPQFWTPLLQQVRAASPQTLRAYLRYELLTAFARNLPHSFDAENFAFYATVLEGQPEQRARFKRCSSAVDSELGEALGKVYVDRYFAGNSKAQTLQMVHDIEDAMGRDIDQLDWMSPATKAKAKEKLALVANKIGYPDKWRDYSALTIAPNDAFGNQLRANIFENDRELNKIGKPVDKDEWFMSPPTVNAYYDTGLNNINFPAGILQPPFFDATQDIASNYGHIGALIGHELTHGFDDEGRKFNGQGNLTDWWTADDLKNFTTRTDCLADEYSQFTAVEGKTPADTVKVNGKLTLGENTADNGGLLLAFMAYMQRAKDNHIDPNAKIDGYTGPQRFYLAYAQNSCENSRPEAIRAQVLEDPHSPDHFRVNGAIVNQPSFSSAFACKKLTPMVPPTTCRVW